MDVSVRRLSDASVPSPRTYQVLSRAFGSHRAAKLCPDGPRYSSRTSQDGTSLSNYILPFRAQQEYIHGSHRRWRTEGTKVRICENGTSGLSAVLVGNQGMWRRHTPL